MSGHTPGPWEASDDAILCGDPDMAIGSVFPCDREKTTYGSGFTYGEVTKANARLIAAAPELLSSHGRLLANFRLLLAGKPVRDVAEMYAEAEAAIAKATGEAA